MITTDRGLHVGRYERSGRSPQRGEDLAFELAEGATLAPLLRSVLARRHQHNLRQLSEYG
jgi:hypothetical protein